MGIAEKIAPAAGNIKDTVQAAIQPYAGSVSGDDASDIPIVENVKEAASNGASWLTGPALNGASVQLHCREACLPLCSSISSVNSNNTLPCWNDAPSSNVIFGKNVGTLGSASLLSLLIVLATMLGFVGGQRVDMNRVKNRVDYERLKEKMDLQRMKGSVPDLNKLKDSVNLNYLKQSMDVDKLKENAAHLVNRKPNITGTDVNNVTDPNDVEVIREE